MTTHPFTPTYIAMAKAAEEIQAMRPAGTEYHAGDHFLYGASGVQLAVDDGRGLPTAEVGDELTHWLPLLHQLLGMLGPWDAQEHALRHALMAQADREAYQGIEGWHELALAVVMREKHGKVWKEGKWVKA